MTGWIGVDLDGTLAYYDGWVSETHIGDPIPEMVARVKRWLEQGETVKIFTARVSGREGLELAKVTAAILLWCQVHIGQKLDITCCKDYDMVELWDDRCVQVIMNTGVPVGKSAQGLS